MKRVLPLFVFVLVAFWDDCVNLILFSIGSANIYPIDLLVGATILYLLIDSSRRRECTFANVLPVPFLFLLAWIVFSVARGFSQYSFSAYGDSRIVLPFVFACLGGQVFGQISDEHESASLFQRLLIGAGLGVLLTFCIELILGHRFAFYMQATDVEGWGEIEDARGIRFLNTVQTFCAGILVVSRFIGITRNRQSGLLERMLVFIMIPVALISQNRTAIVSVSAATLLYVLLIIRQSLNLRIVALVIGSLVCAFSVVLFFFPNVVQSIIVLAQAGIDPDADPTGTWAWRLALAGEALVQFSQAPVLGQGFGEHWAFVLPDEFVTSPPHNQYITLLVKMGMVGFGLLVVIVVQFFKSARINRKLFSTEGQWMADVVWIVVAASIPYGFAYDYVPLFGLYLGAFYGLKSGVHTRYSNLLVKK